MMRRRSNISLRSHAPLVLGILVTAVILGYALLQAYPFLSGPKLVVNPIEEKSGSIIISGSAKRVSSVWINDLPTPITDSGMFAVERAYPGGYTVVTVKAEDRFGRKREEQITFITKNQNGSKKESGESSEENLIEGNNEGE